MNKSTLHFILYHCVEDDIIDDDIDDNADNIVEVLHFDVLINFMQQFCAKTILIWV